MKLGGMAVIAALDIGCSKIACVIARDEGSAGLSVLGAAQHHSRGIVSGKVSDAAAAEEAVRACVSAAEKAAGVNVNEVILTVNGCRQESRKVTVSHEIHDTVTGEAVLRMIDRGCRKSAREGRVLLHGVPLDYIVDGAPGVRAPQGMYADLLAADVHMVDADMSSMTHLAGCLARCHLDMREAVSAPYAAGLACLTEPERDLGVILVDFGGGGTSCALFRDDLFIFGDTFPLGGSHVTRDIAVGLSTSTEYAERLKTLYGSMIPLRGDDHETVEFVHTEDLAAGKNEPAYAPRSLLVNIIVARIEECVDILLSRLPQGALAEAQCGFVVTGGGSDVSGLCEHLKQRTSKPVRPGKPLGIRGLPDAMSGPAFSAVAGALRYEGYKRRRLSLHLKDYCKKKSAVFRLWEWVSDKI